MDQAFVDFDGVRYHLSTPNKKTVLLLSMAWACWDELVKYGALDILQREYGSWLASDVEPDYSVSLEIDIEKVPEDATERSNLIRSLSLLKRNALAAPFERGFAKQKELEAHPPAEDAIPQKQELMSVHYRCGALYVPLRPQLTALPCRPDEAIYVQASLDRVTVVFSTIFKEETDRIFGKVFLQEFVDARRRPSCQTAPQVLYSNREPPLEIRHLSDLATSENAGYVTFGARAWTLKALLAADMRPQSCSPATSRRPTRSTRALRRSKCSATTSTTTSSAPRRTCTRACASASQSFSRSSTAPSQRLARRSERRRAAGRSFEHDDVYDAMYGIKCAEVFTSRHNEDVRAWAWRAGLRPTALTCCRHVLRVRMSHVRSHARSHVLGRVKSRLKTKSHDHREQSLEWAAKDSVVAAHCARSRCVEQAQRCPLMRQ